jgi:hypothetical protein
VDWVEANNGIFNKSSKKIERFGLSKGRELIEHSLCSEINLHGASGNSHVLHYLGSREIEPSRILWVLRS